MENLVDIIFECDIKGLSNLNFPIGERFGLIVHFNNVKYEFLINLKSNSDKLLCLGAGALGTDSKHDRLKPYFNRWSWDFEYSSICYNDPTMYLSDELTGGWGIGVPNDYYLEKISLIILIISQSISVPPENIIFYGSSAGGFMSIMLSILIKGSTAIADIPQLMLENYFNWEDIKKHCFKDIVENDVFEIFKYRFNVVEMCIHENYIPNAILIFDCSVTHDITLQYVPFINCLNQLPYTNATNNFQIIINGKNKGHAPLGKKESYDLLDDVITNKLLSKNSQNFKEFHRSNNALEKRILNNINEIVFGDYIFDCPGDFITLGVNSNNSLKIVNLEGTIKLFITPYGRNGNYCKSDFERMLKSYNEDSETSLIHFNSFVKDNISNYNILVSKVDFYESIYFICKYDKTFRLSFIIKNKDIDTFKIVEGIYNSIRVNDLNSIS